MIDKKMAKIDWNNQNSLEIKNLVRGLNPFMGAYALLNNKKIKLWKIEVINETTNNEPGEVIKADEKEGLIIATLDGTISVIEIQGENSRRMYIKDYLRGNHINIGEKFV